jgi:Mrp family chromosome partitioning ATPase
LEQIQRLYWEAAVISAEKQSLLEKALHDRDRLKELSLQPFADERVADNFGINRIEQWTYEQLQVMRTSIDGLTVDNPDRKYVEERMKAMNDFLADYKKDVNNSTIRNLVSKRDFELNTDVLKAETVAQASKESETLLGDQLEQARKEASDVSETIFRAADIDFSVVQLRERLAALNTRIDDCEMEAKAPVRIAIDKRAERPTTPARSRSRTLIMLAAFLAYGGLAGIFLVFDLLDNRIRCFRQVEQALGGPGPDPVASYVSAVPCQQEFSHVLQVNPGHPAAKAIRDLAVRLNYERERHGARVFVFSGLGPGCGTSTLALNAAQALATLCGRTLLIEMNISRPGLAQWIAPLQPSRFSEDVIATPGDLGACTLHDLERGVDVLPARGGPGGVNLTGLGEMLSFARSSYAAVLLDVGPVFSDDLAHHVLLHADAAVLVAREDVSLYADLRRAIVMLTRADIPALTGVLNFSQHRPDGWLRKVTQTKLGGMSRLHERFNVWRLKLVARWRKSAAGKDV